MPEKGRAMTSLARSTAACGGQIERITWLAAISGASVCTSSSPAAAARAEVCAPRPSDAQSTRSSLARAAAPTTLPISPGCSTPIVVILSMTCCSPLLNGRRSGRPLPETPDLLGRPAMRPLRGHERVPSRGPLRRAELHQIEELEAVGTQKPHPIPDGKRELHRAGVRPLEPMQAEGVPPQTLRRRAVVVGQAQGEEGAVLEEDEVPARPQEPRGLRHPAIRIAPEARPVFRQREIEAGIGQRHTLRVAVEKGKVETVLFLERPRRRELLGGVVDAHHAGAAPGHPG